MVLDLEEVPIRIVTRKAFYNIDYKLLLLLYNHTRTHRLNNVLQCVRETNNV